jgi:hypothetical protein
MTRTEHEAAVKAGVAAAVTRIFAALHANLREKMEPKEALACYSANIELLRRAEALALSTAHLLLREDP